MWIFSSSNHHNAKLRVLSWWLCWLFVCIHLPQSNFSYNNYPFWYFESGKDETLGLVLVSRLKAPRLSVSSRSRLGLAPIFIIDKSRSRTRSLVYLSRSLGPGLVTKYWKSEKFVKVSSCSRLGLETEGTRLSVSSRSRLTFDFQKVSVSDSSICYF